MTYGLPSIRVRAWSNGQPQPTGAGYGLRLPTGDRDRVFDRGWTEVTVSLDGGELARIPLSDSFWHSCPELRSADIGRWLIVNHLAPWPTGSPPALTLRHVTGNHFELHRR